ncbi:DUF5011 domain-containing protein, partial [bacterium]|nr:DUF5011 domain-containing protein [bacterium]
VNYGEGGGSEPLAVDGAGKTLSLNHVYTNEGTFTVSVELEDGDGGTHQDTFQVTVLLNEAPIAACQDLIIAADAVNCSVSVLAANLDGGSTDPDGDLLTLSISPTGPFGVGVHLVNLTVTDPSGLSDSCVATVTVNDTTAPAITLNGNGAVSLECAIDSYTELGASVSDACDPNVTVVIGGDVVDASTNGVYVVTYDATDASGNVATKITRTVTVGDATAPVITLAGAPSVGGGGTPGELTFIATYKNGQGGITGLDGAEKPYVSPDGKNVYAVAKKTDPNQTGFLLVFSRDAVTGELTYLENESGHPGIDGPKHLVVSPDGKWVYVCTLKDQSVLTFSRDATDGRLTYLDTIDVGRNMTYIDTTPDGENLYAVSSRHVERFTIDTVTGLPTWIERVQPPSSSAGDKLTVSDDGKFLYWGDINANRVYVFSIEGTTGGLTHLQTFNNGDSGSLINGVTDLKISPDGLFLYIAATRDDHLTVFSRDVTTGLITYASDIASPSGAVRGLAISPDGATLIAADQSNSIRSYARNFTTGALTLVEEERDGTNGVDGLARSLGVAISPDGNHIYVAARDDDAVTLFELEPGVIVPVVEAFVTLECSVDSYTEYGADATDACDPNVTVLIGGDVVDATVPGVYVVTYDATDASGNAATQVTRTVMVEDTTSPVIALTGDNPQEIECSTAYVELGASASDDCDQALGAVVIDASGVDVSTPGSYVVTYNISDASGNAAVTVARTVNLIDTTPPVVVLLGDSPQVIESPNAYTELGATASDTCDQALGAVVIDASLVDVLTPGSYVVTYNISDATGNAAVTVTRTVNVIDSNPPVITLIGDAALTLECGIDAYTEDGANVTDTSDPGVVVVIGGDTVDPNTPGVYVVTYDATDASENAAAQLIRTVTVLDTIAPVLTLNGDGVMTLECAIDGYLEQGASVSDVCDLNVTVVIGGDTVDSSTPGTYIVTYDATDASGNVATQITRTVTVGDTTSPVITLLGEPPVGGSAGAGELTFIATYKNGQNGITGLDGPEKVAISGDGKHVYAIQKRPNSNNTGSVVVFSRDAATGELTHVETELGHQGIDGALHVIVSPDDRFVYLCTLKDQSVLTFSRDATDGRLTYLDTIDVGRNMTYIDTTPDGKNLYAVSSRHVERFTIDTVTGLPTWIERVQPPSSSAGDKLTVSDDGKFLYWGDINANRVYVFSIDGTTGGVTHLQTFNNGDSGSLISGVTDLKISPDGLFLYIAATRDDHLTVFSRDVTTGLITYASDIASPSGAVRGLAISPDGATLIAADQSNSIRSYARNFTTGALTLVEEERDGTNGVDGLDRSLGVVISPDGNHVYIAAKDDDAVTAFELEPAVITVAEATMTLECAIDSYTEWGASASDACDPNVTVLIGGDVVDATVPGVYVVTYDASDSSGNAAAQVTRTVTVSDVTPPVIVLVGDNPQVIECPNPYVDLGATASDSCDLVLGAVLIDASGVDVSTPGSYVVTYDISDASGNAAVTVTRTVNVIDTTPPVIVLAGSNPQIVEGSSPYVELGAAATDTCDQALGAIVIDASAVDTAIPGIYVVTYDIMDASGNAATTVVRSVEVTDTTPPVITLVGANPQVIECPNPYVELGATAFDASDLALGAVVIDATAVNVSVPGIYPVTYDISDASGNAAVTVVRSVEVIDTTPPVIALLGDNPQLLECPSPYVELGATALDACDQALGLVLIDASAVDAATPGDYVVTYNISDASGNVAVQLTRTVTVRDTAPPVLALLGDNPQLLECPSPYVELGATASDTCDQALGLVLIDASAVDATTPG